MQAQVSSWPAMRVTSVGRLCVLGGVPRANNLIAGHWQQRVEIFRDDVLIWGDYADVTGGDAIHCCFSPVGMSGAQRDGALGNRGGSYDTARDMLEQCRAVVSAACDDLFAVTRATGYFCRDVLGQ